MCKRVCVCGGEAYQRGGGGGISAEFYGIIHDETSGMGQDDYITFAKEELDDNKI